MPTNDDLNFCYWKNGIPVYANSKTRYNVYAIAFKGSNVYMTGYVVHSDSYKVTTYYWVIVFHQYFK